MDYGTELVLERTIFPAGLPDVQRGISHHLHESLLPTGSLANRYGIITWFGPRAVARRVILAAQGARVIAVLISSV